MDPKQDELKGDAAPAEAAPAKAAPAEAGKDEDRRSVTEIRHDIQRTRGELDRTVDALGKKLQPSRVAWEARRRVEPELREAGRAITRQAKRNPGAFLAAGAALVGLLLARKARGKKNEKPFPREQKGV